jgi:hypothetical protein
MDRQRIIDLVRRMREQTLTNGCTPGEAAKFAAKAAEWIEQYAIEEAELKAKDESKAFSVEDVEVVQNYLRTGKKVFNPGMTAVVNALAQGVCCQCILLPRNYLGSDEVTYGIVGDQLDADYVCAIATSVVPALSYMADLEGAEHGYEKAGLVRWRNQYLSGAAIEIQRRLEQERRERSCQQERQALQLRLEAAGNRERVENLPAPVVDQMLDALRNGTLDLTVRSGSGCTAIACITGESLAVIKREAVATAFKEMYPATKTTRSRSGYDHTANECGRRAGKTVGLRIGLEGK